MVSRLRKLVLERRTELWRLGLSGLVQIIPEKLLKLVRVINNSDSISSVMGKECYNSRVPLMLFYAKALLWRMERLDRSVFWLSSTQNHPRHQPFQDWKVMAHTARKRINKIPKKLSLHLIRRVTSYSKQYKFVL